MNVRSRRGLQLRLAPVTAIIAAASLPLALMQPAPAQAARAAGAASTSRAVAAAAASTVITLITGTRVAVTRGPDGQLSAAVLGSRPAVSDGSYTTLAQPDGSTEFIPDAAEPYLEAGLLSPSLFNLNDLLGATAAGRTPVDVTFSGPVRNLPGLPVTATGPHTGTGYVTSRQAPTFAAALSGQFGATVARVAGADTVTTGTAGTGPVASGKLAGVRRITLAGFPSRPTAPAGEAGTARSMVGLTVKVIAPVTPAWVIDNVTVEVSGVSGARAYSTSASGVLDSTDPAGALHVKVPAGTYNIVANFTGTPGPNQLTDAEAWVARPQIAITGKSKVELFATKATRLVAFHTPRPATPLYEFTGYARESTYPDHGNPTERTTSIGVLTPDVPIMVQPTRPVTQGVLYFSAEERATPSSNAYSYDVTGAWRGRIPHHGIVKINRSQLAEVTNTYYSQGASQIQDARSFFLGWPQSTIAFSQSDNAPLKREEYISTDTGGLPTLWYHLLTDGTETGWHGEWTTYQARSQRTSSWFSQPAHPSPNIADSWIPICGCGPEDASITRQGNTLNYDINPYSDNVLGHATSSGVVPDGTASYTLTQNGTQIASGTRPLGTVSLPSAKAAYQLQIDTSASPSTVLSSSVQTTWTFHSSAAQGSGRLPAGYICSRFGTPSDRHCTAVPLWWPMYNLSVNSSDEASAGGPMTIGVNLDNTPGAVKADTVSSVSLSVSFDGGTTWAPESLTPTSSGGYQAQFTNPALSDTNGYVALKLTATNTNGSSVSQTAINAYQLS